MKEKTLAEAAAQEALEEAGVEGKVSSRSLGSFVHTKQRFMIGGKFEVEVLIHSLEVQRVHENWLEGDQRTREWFRPGKAAELVASKKLGEVIVQLGKQALREGPA